MSKTMQTQMNSITNCNNCYIKQGTIKCKECNEYICNNTYCGVLYQQNAESFYTICRKCNNSINNKLYRVKINECDIINIKRISSDLKNLHKLSEMQEMIEKISLNR